MTNLFEKIENLVAPLTITALLLYGLEYFLLDSEYGRFILAATLVIGTIPLIYDIGMSIMRKQFGVDLIALVSISGSFLLGEYLAGTVILLMLSGGEYLENFALRRSRKELKTLLDNAPKVAHIKLENNEIKNIPIAEAKVGQVVIVKPGEIVPVDGVIIAGEANIDEANLTGESVPAFKAIDASVYSGTVNQDGVLEVKVSKTNAESKYQQIIELIKTAEKEKAPFVRLADRYSVWFTAIAFSLALIAGLATQDAIRALTVLVVATPCPLILATPIAFASGISKAASRGVIFKTGGVIEQLANAKAIIFDKTGTLTLGALQLEEIRQLSNEYNPDKLLEIAASIDQLSEHIVAKAIVRIASEKSLQLTYPKNFSEEFGEGVSAEIDGVRYFLGKPDFIERQGVNLPKDEVEACMQHKSEGILSVLVATSEDLLGCLKLKDKPRENVQTLFEDLKLIGIDRIAMLTGDKERVAAEIAKQFDINEYQAECMPEDKVNYIKQLFADGFRPVVMIGDGVNDAPALATADVGIAMGTSGNTATTNVGDVVIIVNEIHRLSEIIHLSKRVLKIAKQGINIGIGLSICLMILGAFGLFTPVFGALAQEVIDVIVILNALRVNIPQKKM